ncbi:hypothetical protein A2U01_0091499, partial [Trifolium medium]|nr:hypothetical protein [Trifolium medium]
MSASKKITQANFGSESDEFDVFVNSDAAD